MAIAPPFTLTALLVDAEVAHHGERLRGERLVQLDEVDVADLDPVRSSSLRTAGTGRSP